MSTVARYGARELERAGVREAARASYARDGFLTVESFQSAAECAELRSRIADIACGADRGAGANVFSTRSHSYAKDRYFADSGDKIRFFFDEGAVDASGALDRAPLLALNKVGHALHALDPVFAAFSCAARIRELLDAIGVPARVAVQSMYLFKQPEIGGEVALHQDASFLMTDPPSVVGLWFALEDATVDNGCLHALAGAHRCGLHRRFVRDGDEMRFETLQAAPWPDVPPVPLEAPAGSLVVLHGLLPHGSAPNRSSRSRHAYSVHFVDADCAWRADNWMPAPAVVALGDA